MIFSGVLASGCDPRGPTPTATVTDSAGIRVVVTTQASQPRSEVGPPDLIIGEADGDPDYLFDHVRRVSKLSDGSFVVADAGSNSIRVFSPSGTFLARFGGPGEGPGEFRLLGTIAVLPGDSIAAHDRRSHRLSVFDRSGSLLYAHQLPDDLVGTELVGASREGSYLFAGSPGVWPSDSEGLQRPLRPYFSWSIGRDDARVLLTVLGYEFYVMPGSEGAGYEIPYARNVVHSVGAQRWFMASTDRFEIREYGFSGELVALARFPAGEFPIRSEDAARLEQAVVEAMDPSPSRREAIEALFRDVPRPPIQPTLSHLVAGRDGRLWAAAWSSPFAPWSDDPREWWVLDGQRVVTQSVLLNGAFELHDAGADWLLGVHTDELGVERIWFFDLEGRPF